MEKNINPDLIEKIFYSAFKLMLYDKDLSLNLYEPELDIFDHTFKITNVETNEVLVSKGDSERLKEIFGKYYLDLFRANYRVFFKSIKIGLISPDELYKLAKSNDGNSLQNVYDNTYETDPELIESENSFQEKLESFLNKSSKEREYPSKGNSRYCTRCQESPCMCSDPDPD